MKKLALSILAIIAFTLLTIWLYFLFSPCGIAPWSCGDYSSDQKVDAYKISVGDGPEDMAIDTSTGVERIIVSCSNRRGDDPENGRFYQINLKDHSSSLMTITPRGLSIFPHGIDIETIHGTTYLYAISHNRQELDTEHKIFRFIIRKDTLVQDESYVLEDPMLTGPNDIDVLADGSFYVSNPMPSNKANESTKAILGFKNGNVLHYDGNGNWTIAIEELCYPNGVWVNQEDGQLLVANGGCQAVERYLIRDGQIDQRDKLSTAEFDIDIPIGDNLMMDKQGVLWTAAHPCPLKFVSHVQDSDQKSPIQIFAIDPTTMKTNLVFQNNGDLISAASTAIRLDGRLYLSQVFDPFVIVLDGIQF